MISPPLAASATLASYIAVAALSPGSLALLTGLMMAELTLLLGSIRPASLVAKWSLPFVMPLLVIHGVLNRSYPVDSWLLGLIPLRFEGAIYAVEVSLKIVLLAAVASYWFHTRRDDLADGLMRLKLPLSVVMFASQSVAVAATIERRVKKVYLAQQARGISVGPGFFTRIKALPSILVPVVVSTFLEAEGRIPALVSRGFGTSDMPALATRPATIADLVWAGSPFAILLPIWISQAIL
ncbi:MULTISPECIES: energy-coupling factor transporter transmembrane component T [unclassified Bradyrhizobium]|uniref:energy-coupling factor transporter transmembrane component T n=1 Tax=unclassified Bradyrhizobium TaxID=2631580 RepID=UPI002916264A|nr:MULTISPECIES: energy-coupling factor transporter transmembrane component T [unclassified Bradyrhizobium]